jgi:hypothetical protein
MAEPATLVTGERQAGPGLTPALELEMTGPASLAQVMTQVEDEVIQGQAERYRPIPTGFEPLDDILNGGLRRGDLLVIGGSYGVGKTIFGLQVARNVVRAQPDTRAIYICYEHSRDHLMQRLMCLESAERGDGDEALNLRRLGQMSVDLPEGVGLISRLQSIARYRPVIETMADYGKRLMLVKASGYLHLDDVRRWGRGEPSENHGTAVSSGGLRRGPHRLVDTSPRPRSQRT